jgi:hypothetical protein
MLFDVAGVPLPAALQIAPRGEAATGQYPAPSSRHITPGRSAAPGGPA